ncbi:zinc finger BED domain-containing protein RICESLEEPER 2-like [Coffea arabica]|uniref:Zinc finger BED domain-containing protein RICESLEEPER 2-like n=1 Tax=Coffea arabica TaxID=13443 RepID=A0ABM4UF88_COFAR
MSTKVESNLSHKELEQEGSSGTLPPSRTTQSCEESGFVKKREEYKKRSKAWDHFQVKHLQGVHHAICKYCEKDIAVDPKSNGTTPLNTHVAKCPLNPKNKPTNQATLCLGETETLEGEVKGALISWKFDTEATRKIIAYMVIVDKLPFKHVEGKGFQYIMRTACPSFRIPLGWTISRDCYQLYLDEKIKLKHLLKNNSGRICLTTDSWTSIQRINYMCLTTHFKDNDWKLNKKILNFCSIASHKGNEIGKAIEKCLLEWWNSTYLMLETSQRFEEQDPYMLQELKNLPTKSDWTKARFLVIFLENFYQLTVKVFGSKYVTSNNFFIDISYIHGILIEMVASDNDELSSMARSMKEKYDKYWGKIEKINMLIFISSILDPRTKLEYLEFVVGQMYGEFDGATLAGLAKDAMFELFNEYKMLSTLASHSASSSLSSDSQRGKTTFHGDASKTIIDRYKLEFKKRKMELGGRDAKSKLDIYLNEESEKNDERFDILLWWKANSLRFPILSKIARDVLAVPISTVASESAFSIGGHVLDTFRSSLTPRILQGLICAQDWLRSSKTELNVEENMEELEAFESGKLSKFLLQNWKYFFISNNCLYDT